MSDTAQLTRTPTLVQLSRKLKGIGQIEKCEGCGCYVDTIREFESVLDRSGDASPDAQAAREVIDELKERHTTTHGCIGCDPCYPVGVSNSLYALSDGESVEGVEPGELSGACDTGSGRGCAAPQPVVSLSPASIQPTRTESKREVSWPIEAGDYRLGNVSGPVAIATLASEELYKHFSASLCDESCAICGKVFTENIGIEKVVKNIIANRHVRFLILCGREAKGHQTGACIKALHARGLNERGRIAEAPGKRPWIKTLTPAQVLRFQKQVEVVDLIGCEDVATIEEKARELAAHNPGAMPDEMIAEGVPHHVASDKVKLRLDRAGFFIIHPKPEANWIMVEHYKNSGEPTCVVEGSDPAVICAELIERGLVSQLDHAAYLGRELERAKLSMRLGFTFAQDRALGELDADSTPEW
jgi:tetrahydromethanopterin S-methyltransferase subunit A